MKLTPAFAFLLATLLHTACAAPIAECNRLGRRTTPAARGVNYFDFAAENVDAPTKELIRRNKPGGGTYSVWLDSAEETGDEA